MSEILNFGDIKHDEESVLCNHNHISSPVETVDFVYAFKQNAEENTNRDNSLEQSN